jgi:hypothetical protein
VKRLNNGKKQTVKKYQLELELDNLISFAVDAKRHLMNNQHLLSMGSLSACAVIMDNMSEAMPETLEELFPNGQMFPTADDLAKATTEAMKAKGHKPQQGGK